MLCHIVYFVAHFVLWNGSLYCIGLNLLHYFVGVLTLFTMLWDCYLFSIVRV